MKKLISLIKTHWQKILIIILAIYLLILNNKISNIEKKLGSNLRSSSSEIQSDIDKIKLNIDGIEDVVCMLSDKLNVSVSIASLGKMSCF